MNGIDTTTPAPPAVLFYITRSRIRAGKGVRAIEPTSWVNWGGKPGAVNCKGGTYCGLEDCWPTELEALAMARAIVKQERQLESERFSLISARINAADNETAQAARRLMEAQTT